MKDDLRLIYQWLLPEHLQERLWYMWYPFSKNIALTLQESRHKAASLFSGVLGFELGMRPFDT